MQQAIWTEDSKYDVSVQGEERSPARAVAASIFFPGLGQFYCGKYSRAFAIFLVPFALLSLLTVLWANQSQRLDFNFMILLLAVSLGYMFWVAYDAYREARNVSGEYIPGKYNQPAFYICFALMVVILVGASKWSISCYYVRSYKVAGDSMSPTLLTGDRFLGNFAAYRHRSPKRGDVAVVRFPQSAESELPPSSSAGKKWLTGGKRGGEMLFYRRVVGLPGDRILISNTGDLFLNGTKESVSMAGDPYDQWLTDGTKEQVQQYLTAVDDRYYRILIGKIDLSKKMKGEITVPADHYFVLSDFRTKGHDSREVGLIPRDNFVALAGSIYFSSDHTEGIRWERSGARIK